MLINDILGMIQLPASLLHREAYLTGATLIANRKGKQQIEFQLAQFNSSTTWAKLASSDFSSTVSLGLV